MYSIVRAGARDTVKAEETPPSIQECDSAMDNQR